MTMPPLDPQDPHTPYIQELAEAGDWAALARYWLAHSEHEPALGLAIALVKDRAGQKRKPWSAVAILSWIWDRVRRKREHWSVVASFLEDIRREPISFEREPPQIPLDDFSISELGTLELLALYPRIALCEHGTQFPTESQSEILQIGIAAADQAVVIAKDLDDFASLATLSGIKGNARSNLSDLEGATASYEEALAIRRELALSRPDAYRGDVAGTLNNLGNARSDLGDLEGATASYEEALAAYRELALSRPEAYRGDVAMTLNNLGTARIVLGDLEGATASFEEAARIYEQEAKRQPTARLPERLTTWANLGRLMLEEKPELGSPDRPAARSALEKAVEYAEQLREQFRDERQRRRVQGEYLQVYERLVEVCVDLWEIDRDPTALTEAVETAEKSRARRLMELLAGETLRPANTSLELEDEFRSLRDQLQRSILRFQHEAERSAEVERRELPPETGEGRARGPTAPAGTRRPNLQSLQADVDRIRAAYQDALRRIRLHDREFQPDLPVPPIDTETAQRLVPDDIATAIVHYSLTPRRGLALIMTRDGIQHVPLPGLSVEEAIDLANQWYQGYYETCRVDQSLDGRLWSNHMRSILEVIGERAIRPVFEKFTGIKRVIFVPNRALHIFPLHACPLGDGRLVIDAFDVAYTPSLSILHRCAERSRPHPDRLLTVENPTADLGFTEAESAVIRPHFDVERSERRSLAEAQREWLLEHSSRFQAWHYAGHSHFDPNDPLGSGLVLEDAERPDRWLTLRDVFTQLKLPETTLAVLSGCESGSILPDRTDEYVGLLSGFLFAGATCVVASLWAVPDLATALLMGRFYANWRKEGMNIGAALREAQRWLRDDIKTGTQLRDEIATDTYLDHVTDPKRRERCRRQRDALARGYPDSPPFGGLADWGAFTAIGLAYPKPGTVSAV